MQIRSCYYREYVLQVLMFFADAPFQTMKKPDQELTDELRERHEKVWQRLSDAIDDAIKILETELPEWLTDEKREVEPARITATRRNVCFENTMYSFDWLLHKLQENDEEFQKRLASADVSEVRDHVACSFVREFCTHFLTVQYFFFCGARLLNLAILRKIKMIFCY